MRSAYPGGRIVELGERRQVLRGAPGAVEALDPPVAHDRVAEALADEVLAHLEVEAEQALEQLDQRRLLAPPALERLAQLGQRGQHRRAGGVHHVLGVALDERHDRLKAIDDLLALGPGDRMDETVLAHRVPRRAQVLHLGQAQKRGRVDLDLDRGEQLAQHRGQVLAQPRDPRELHRVGDLVEDDPLEQLCLVGLEGARGLAAGWAPPAAAAAGARDRAAPARTGRARCGP